MALLRRTLVNVLCKRNFKVATSFHNKETASNVFEDDDDANISRTMKIYKKKAIEQKKFMDEKLVEYDIGKRHLANMMGADVQNFTDDDIKEAIKYLLPSGLFDVHSRPVMKHPTELFPKLKEAEFDNTGRPKHSLFYTGQPIYYQILQNISLKVQELDKVLTKQIQTTLMNTGFQYTMEERKLDLGGSRWLTCEKLENLLLERMNDSDYEYFIHSMNRLVAHPMAYREEKFIEQFRESIVLRDSSIIPIKQPMYTELGIPYVTEEIGVRQAYAIVTVYGKGSGQITINGDDITFFESHQEREQVLFPLQFTGMLNNVDIDAKSRTSDTAGRQLSVEDKRKKMGQAYAIRHAICFALRSFVNETMIEKMRIAGLLTHDIRQKERKKPGKRRARRAPTWKKR